MSAEPEVAGSPLAGRRITLGVTGSVAAYKAAELASALVKRGADVHAILTPSAARFIGGETFRALTLNPALTDLFDEPHARRISHIDLAQQTDLIIVAPATASILAKMAHGLADDLLAATLLAATAPILAAPAMNTAMWEHPATRDNVETLRGRGVRFLNPVSGLLACRTEGEGKMAEPLAILAEAESILSPPNSPLAGRRVLVTAGATREPLDPVRFISNRSSGRMGCALAAEAAARGARVTLVYGIAAIPPPAGVETICVETTVGMLRACEERFDSCDLFIAAAAPADYAPESPLPAKRKKSTGAWTLALRETPDILASLAARRTRQVLIGFAAETEDLLARAEEKLRRKGLDLIVANDVTAPGAGFEVETNAVTLLWPDGRRESLPLQSKRAIAARILDAAESALPDRRPA